MSESEQEQVQPPPEPERESGARRSRWRSVSRPFTAARFHHLGQGLFGFAGFVALAAGAALYYFERRDKPRIVLEPVARVIRLAAPDGGGGGDASPGEVLLHVRITIENRSARGVWFRCAAIDVIGLAGGRPRDGSYIDDLEGRSLLDRQRPVGALANDEVWRNCMEHERRRRGLEGAQYARDARDDRFVNPPRPTPAGTSGARYRDFFMEPGEIATRTWEQRVPCSYDAVRVIFKLPKPDSYVDYETKIVVPIADVCREERQVSVHRFAGGAATGDGEAADAAEQR